MNLTTVLDVMGTYVTKIEDAIERFGPDTDDILIRDSLKACMTTILKNAAVFNRREI